ncbi:hypothetical protein FNV43_RR05948 [Rhamnella rubrinervis]|uniref:Uncharacterized protein n=1 Tax=Rhamnella rubrinervis TaxID=2594499 RepID=A0A8K0MKY3_9ROSA|nr:hypothetical protein FNV43_RR05948 [Rhamnella rubrinervis]
MAANQKDEESNIVVDLRTRVSNLSKYINIKDKDETQLKELLNSSTTTTMSEPHQIHAHVAIEQLRGINKMQEGLQPFLEEYSGGGGNLDYLGFKIRKTASVESSSSSKPKSMSSKKEIIMEQGAQEP